MPAPSDEQALIERFSKTYGNLTRSQSMMEIERTVCGCDYGCTSWTTRNEADDVGKMLALGPGVRFLEIGAGAGWPGLYLAKETGCDVALIDLPLEGLRIAKERAERDGLAGICRIAQADGAALPFRDASFTAIYHSDVLCCLIEKQAVLGECRRIIQDAKENGGKMVFSVVLIAPGLSAADYDLADAGGPTFIAAPAPYPDMIEQAGWEITDHADQTAAYYATFRHMYDLEKAHSGELERARGAEGAAELFARRARCLDAIERNLLRRELFSVVPAG